ncbi:PspC domain-containing protein [Spongiactinospora sp. TRM90649]|uniref:PspC domain-containing protein n=1 Tax=Spongiactinospora sp. TRM90649 TaxID=3031114 RepID=UPI0023F7CF81|nr:PspC domain-containing protein [Spongiactinospora sp. TRM90649]MDF5754409.1 PspC domain-containing protein [Spongiactinospora sp. TRM90649]
MYRSREHRIVAGVCGGIADKLGLPPTLVRIVWLLLSLIPGPLWVVYVAMWILIPEEPSEKYPTN